MHVGGSINKGHVSYLVASSLPAVSKQCGLE
jgi:hypothetical protein